MAVQIRNFLDLVAENFTRGDSPGMVRCNSCPGKGSIALAHQSVMSHLRSKTHREKVAEALAEAEKKNNC